MSKVNISMRRAVLVFTFGSVLSLAACGEDSGKIDRESDGVIRPGPYASSSHRPVGVVGVKQVPRLGKIVADDRGIVLYAHEKEGRKGDSRAICIDDCVKEWRPVLAENGMPVAFPGIQSDSLGIKIRGDGGKQVTLYGRPLYRYVKDVEPGQFNGHGIDGFWHAITPSGENAKGK